MKYTSRFLASLLMPFAFVSATVLAFTQPARAEAAPTGAQVSAYIQEIGQQTLDAVLADTKARSGDINAIGQFVDKYVVSRMDLNKTTRLAVGYPWRNATKAQRTDLINAFRNKVMHTYRDAFLHINESARFTVLPYTGPADAKDAVVQSILSVDGKPYHINYRMERKGDQWRVYDFSVEGIWLIQSYRGQFQTIIRQKGIQGLINTLRGSH